VDEKARAEEQKERLTRMFVALSATNEAIMRAKSRTEMFDLVCAAAVVGGNFTSTAIFLAKPGEAFLQYAAAAGPDCERAKKRYACRPMPRAPRDKAWAGPRSTRDCPAITNDYLKDFAGSHFRRGRSRERNTIWGAAFPLLKDGSVIGVLVFFSSELGAFSVELIGLLQRLAENVSFALDKFRSGG